MTRRLALAAMALAVLAAAPAVPALAHPHSFVECSLAFVFDADGLAGIRQAWVLDAMTTAAVLDVVDADRDGRLDKAEAARTAAIASKGLKEYGFYTHVRVDGSDFPVQWVRDFTAELRDGRVAYAFFVPCHVKAALRPKKVRVAVYDGSFYTYVGYAAPDAHAPDPTADPLFADRSAPASPEDFARFSEAVGLKKGTPEAALEGEAARFDAKASVGEQPDMAYFYGQVVPQAFVVEFRDK